MDISLELDVTKKKKKRICTELCTEPQTQTQTNDFYTYKELLYRVFDQTFIKHEKITIPKPILMREGTKKTVWLNVYDTSNTLQRAPEHIKSFLEREMKTTCSLGEEKMVLCARLSQCQMETLLSSYIKTYVECKACKSLSTTIERDSVHRIHILLCNTCKASRSLSMF